MPYLTELPGLVALDEIDFHCGPAEYDVTAMWRDDATGQLYYADDAGYDAPFDDGAPELIACTADELRAHLGKRLAKDFDGSASAAAECAQEIAELMTRVRTT